jgi:N-methylhydantoinase A
MAKTTRAGCRIGIDVGGTFTDFVLTNRATGELVRYKEPSVPADPSMSVRRGIPNLLERAKVGPGDVELIVHGTTLLVNAIIQHRGARVGLVVGTGHRGVLEIGRMSLASSHDFTLRKEEPLVPRDRIFEIPARVNVDGTVVTRPSAADIRSVAAQLRAAKVESVCVLLLNAYAHPQLEASIADQLLKQLKGVPVTASAAIWPERREFERGLVAILNAYCQPIMTAYLDLLQARVKEIGIDAPVYITASNGGTLSIDSARDRPIDTVLSGPASGLLAATRVSQAMGRDAIITIDMGGTSCDVALNQGPDPEYTTSTRIGDYPLILPVVNVLAIGAGGGSIISVDRQGVLKVGPESAGADPGPVCYGRGGRLPTITDAYLLAGYIDPAHFLGGRMRLDRDAASAALAAIGARLGYEGADAAVRAADAALRVCSAMMATELFKGLARRGADPRDFALMAFGGAGPTHGVLLAEEARLRSVVVPPASATFCAMGAILADVKRDYVRSQQLKLSDATGVARIGAILAELEDEARQWIKREGAILGEIVYDAALDMRYAGQAFDLQVAVPDALRRKPDAGAIAELFHRAHERIYSFRDLESAIDVTTLRLRVTGRIPPVRLPPAASGGDARPVAQRRIHHAGVWHDVPVYLRRDLGTAARIAGPAIIEQEDCTAWLLPAWTATIDATGSMVFSRDD